MLAARATARRAAAALCAPARAGAASSCVSTSSPSSSGAASSATSSSGAVVSPLRRPAELEEPNYHRSNAMELVARVPVVDVDAVTAMCDGGGGATGHPIEYIRLDLKEGAGAVNACKYCGVRYRRAQTGHHH